MEVNIMNIIISIVGILVGGGVAYGFISHFLKLTKEKQITNIKEWLVFACIEAEKLLGSKITILIIKLKRKLDGNKYEK